MALVVGLVVHGLGDLDQHPVGVLRMDERLSPVGVVRADHHEVDPSCLEALHLFGQVFHAKGHVVHTFSSASQEPGDEPVADGRDQLDPTSGREPVLDPPESLGVVVSEPPELGAEHVPEQFRGLRRVLDGDGYVIDLRARNQRELGQGPTSPTAPRSANRVRA